MPCIIFIELNIYILYMDAATAAANAPISTINIIKLIKEITNPAMASPRGCLNTPIKENIKPSNHRIQFKAGTQQSKIATIESTKPAVPNPLDCFCWINTC